MKKRIRPSVPRTHRVSKTASPEEYYMTLLQLYWPWRDERHLKHSDGTYTSKFDEVKHLIHETISRFENYDQITEEDLDNAHAISSDDESQTSDSGSEYDDDDLSGFNLDNLDIEDPDDFVGASTTCKVTNKHMENTEYYELYTRLNEEQRFLFNFIMRKTQEQLHFKGNNTSAPDPYFVFLSGGGGVGKTYTVKGIIEYLRRHFKFRGQNSEEQPSILVCASTGTAAVRIKGQTLHSNFSIPCKQHSSTKLSDQSLNKLQRKCLFLQTVIHDEISMTGIDTWSIFEERLRQAKNIRKENYTNAAYGDVNVLATGDFFQLPPVMESSVFSISQKNRRPLEQAFSRHIWKDYFYLHELTEIVRQQGDPIFAEVMSRVRTGIKTDDDMKILNELVCHCCKLNCRTKCQCECKCITDSPCEPISLFCTNDLANFQNQKKLEELASLGHEVYEIKAKDSAKDKATGRVEITESVYQDKPITQTGNLPGILKICVGARVLLTVNINVSDGTI